jgi:tight adherence protein B
MKAKIQAMSAEAKAGAMIIGAMPIIVAVLVYITSPDYIALLWTDPRGQMVLVVSATVMGMGILVMRKMINFDF